MQQQNKKLLNICVIGLMAAVVFVASKFLSFEIPVPIGPPTRLHLGNVFCILSGLLFGPWSGGASAGIGSALMDLTYAPYIADTPFTLINKFCMGFVAGRISHHGKHSGESFRWNVVAAIAGQITYIILYLTKTFFMLLLEGNHINAVWVSVGQKALTSTTNGIIAVIVAVPLAAMLRQGLRHTTIFQTLVAKPAKQ